MVHGSPLVHSGVCLRKRRVNDEDEYNKKPPTWGPRKQGDERAFSIVHEGRSWMCLVWLHSSLSLITALSFSTPSSFNNINKG